MVRRALPSAALAAFLLSSVGGCDADSGGGSEAFDGVALESAKSRRGELLSLACQVCHTLTPGDGPDIGPSLHGVFGRPAGSLPDFEYSDALRSAGFVWTPERLDAWLQAPMQFLPGTTMVFAGYGDAQDRAALIAWLQAATAPALEQ